MATSVEQMMDICIRLAREAAASGNYALGALVARDGEIIAESGSSLIVDDNDPSAHPEMSAIRAASRRTGSRYLRKAVLFSTLEPCPMCVSVAIWAKMDGVVFGATQQDALDWAAHHPSDVYTWRQIRIRADEVARAGEPRIDVQGGVLRAACNELFDLTPGRRPDAG
ncbi:nucleoside deaminase [Actinomadura nitritigenes]|uniref:nucleoside deaminase n=1 Tax=Actinomadura nitritigenes TaxID=134602 RepID=UPI003D8F40FC